MMAVRVVVAEDSVLLREGIVRLLREAGFDVCGQAGDAEELVRLVEELRPDVAIVDIRMPPGLRDEGIVATRAIRGRHGDAIGVLVLSQHVEPEFALRILEEGGRGLGYLLKDRIADIGEFAESVRRVANGGSVMDQAIVAQLLARRRRADPLEALTERERDVLGLMAEGLSNQAIAGRLTLSEKTVESYTGAIFGKLALEPAPELHRRVLAVLAFLNAR
jgi:DNA-binding NarL/FixJ family response regulator